jgi:uncharacterized protein YbjT (DUF2867 family)
LAELGEPIRALVHREEQISLVESAGAQDSVTGDIHDSKFLAQAVSGVRAVYHICPSADLEEATVGETLIQAAKEAGVEHFVFHSVMHPQLQGLTHHIQKLRVEEKLIQSDLPFTIIQPASYMQNILDSWDQITNGVYPSMYALSTCVGMVDLDDVGDAAATILGDVASHKNATYELCSGDCLSVASIIELWEKHLGIAIEGMITPRDAWEERIASFGRDPERIATLTRMFDYYEAHGFPGNANVLSWLLQRKATSYEEFVVKTIRQKGA